MHRLSTQTGWTGHGITRLISPRPGAITAWELWDYSPCIEQTKRLIPNPLPIYQTTDCLIMPWKKVPKNQATKSSYTESSMVSVAARLNYAYKERYMATVTVRADASSRFAKATAGDGSPLPPRHGECLKKISLKDVEWLDNLKLRLSYGITGNNNVGDYATSYYNIGTILCCNRR